MPYIPYVTRDEAEGRLAEIYADFTGNIDNVLLAHSQVPEALAALMTFYRNVMHGDLPLSMTERETVAVTVSAANECHY